MGHDNPGYADLAPSGGEYADISAMNRRGALGANNRPGLLSRGPKIRKRTGPKPKTKYSRCPSCGGMVIAPCIACNPESAYDPRLDSESSD